MHRLWTCLWFAVGATACADYGLAESQYMDGGTQMEPSDYRRLQSTLPLQMLLSISYRSHFGLMKKPIGKISIWLWNPIPS